jgi:alcohol dehydrogenase (cytochrome c)
MTKPVLLATSAAVALLAAAWGPPAGAADSAAPSSAAADSPNLATDAPKSPAYAPVTQERLDKQEPGNWLTARGNYEGWGYSPLDQITAANVKELVPVWTLSTGVAESHQAPTIVNNGVMFVSTPQNRVLAIRAANGDLLWRYERELPAEMVQLHPTNRGVALYGDKVYMATMDACVVALDAKTGAVAWEKCVADWNEGYYMTLAPLAAKGKVMVGVSGGELGIRGFVAALDAETGEEAWRAHTVPGPGEPGHETWKGDTWKTGGAPVWMQGHYDPASGLAYFGTGNGGPWMPDTRPGDNLYATSTIALDVETGKIKGHHQYHWNDAWDWDEVSAPLLIDVQQNGHTIPAAVHAGRNGYLWVLERTKEGPIKFVNAWPYVNQDAFASIDKTTGRPTYNPDKTPGTGKRALFCPSLWGGKDWPQEAYSPKTGLFYIPANDNLCAEIAGVPVGEYEPGQLYIGVPIEDIFASMRLRPGLDPSKPVPIGELQAWDVASGKKVWSHQFHDQALWGPILTTAGDLVFAGGTRDRYFRAFDAKSGKLLWQTRLNSGVQGVPTSFEVDGTQYIAVQAGWGVDAERQAGGLIGMFEPRLGSQAAAAQDGAVWVFALRDRIPTP